MENISFTPKKLQKLFLLMAIFILSLTTANLLGAKVTNAFGVAVSVAIFTYPLTFTISNIIEEVYGKAVARQFIVIGVVVLLALFVIIALSLQLPTAERFAERGAAYTTTFQSSLRIIAGSLIAFLLSQLHNIWAFGFWKKQTRGRFLWLRTNYATMVSQAIDTLVFMFIAFYHLTPKFTAVYVLYLCWSYWMFKAFFSLASTPIVYAGVRWLRGAHITETVAPHATAPKSASVQ